MYSTKKVIKNIFWLNGLEIAQYINGFFIGTSVIRSFGPEQFGNYGYAISITYIFGAIVGIGLERPLIKGLSSHEEENNALLASSFVIFISTSFLAYLAILIYAFTNAQQELKVLLAITGFGLIFRFTEIHRCWFLSDTESKEFVNSKVKAIIVSAIVKTIVIVLNYPIICIATADLLSAVTLASMLERKKSVVKIFLSAKTYWIATLSSVKTLGKQSLPLLLTGIVVTLNIQIDTLIVKYFMTAKDVGLYLAAVKIPLMIAPALASIEQTMLPINVKQMEARRGLTSILNKTNSPSIYISLIVSISISLLAQPITKILYGNTYAESAYVLTIIAYIVFVGCIAKIQSQYCLLVNKNMSNFYRQVITLLLNIVLDTLLIQQLGLIGAALGTLLSLLIGLAIYCMTDKRFTGILVNILTKPDFYYLKLASGKLIN